MIARDLDGNEWNARAIDDSEYEKVKLRHGWHEASRNGSRALVLLNEGSAGIAFPKGYKNEVMYYGGLEYTPGGPEEVNIDGDRYIAFIFDKINEAHEERCDERGRWYDLEKTDTHAWSNYLYYLEDKWWNEDGTPNEEDW
tara:strand:- start:944 stop:1366 length:423 start_codon:yes stop_codon:yes gene_type:complete